MATRILASEAETGTELCRVKREGGSLGGYRSEILTENLSEREKVMLKCPRCEGIMKDACLSNTGEQMCFVCVRKDEQICPNTSVRTTIVSLKCSCPLSKRGCDWLGMLENVSEHLTTCGQVFESCQLSCGVVSTRDEMGRHMREECSQREEECLHCSGLHKVCEMVEHVKVCGKVSVLCELGCGTRVCRESISCHRENECSEERVVCPYVKYRCEVVALKRRELKQHLEDNWRIHTELKLNAMEQQTELKLNTMEQQTELKLNAMEQQIELKLNGMVEIFLKKNESLEKEIDVLKSKLEIKDEEIESLQELHVRAEGKVEWSIKNILTRFKPNLGYSRSGGYNVAGYNFCLYHSTDVQNFNISFYLGSDYRGSLECPFKAICITRVISHRDTKDSLMFRSPIIVIQKNERYAKKLISSFPLSTDLKDFIRSDSLDLEVTVRILKNI